MATAKAISPDIIKPKFDTIFKNIFDILFNGWLEHFLLIKFSDWTTISMYCCDSGDVIWIVNGSLLDTVSIICAL